MPSGRLATLLGYSVLIIHIIPYDARTLAPQKTKRDAND